jgi:transposase InsO family protein
MTQEERNEQDRQTREQVARIRFEAIAPTLGNDPQRSIEQRLKVRSLDWVKLPDGRRRRFSWRTLAKWRERYLAGNLDGLKDDPRQDRGLVKAIPAELQQEIERLYACAPSLKTQALFAELRTQGKLTPPEPGRATLYRFVRTLRAQSPVPICDEANERLGFEAGFANQLWQADILYGPEMPKMTASGRWQAEDTYLIAIIDDYSRLICHAEFGFSQNLEAWLQTLKMACCKRGIPQKLYCDNGQVFRSEQTSRICALMGTHLTFTPVRDAAAKGKIEAFFRGLRSRFLEPTIKLGKATTLERLNELFRQWLENDYHRQSHRGIDKECPLDRWVRTSNHVRRLSDDDLDRKVFLLHDRRRVGKTGLIRWGGRFLETSRALVGKKVDLYYDPSRARPPFVWFEGVCHGRASEHAPAENYNRRRNRKPSDGDSK